MELKKTKYVGLAILCLGILISCNDDDGEKDNKANIVGSWVATSQSTIGCDDPDNNTSVNYDCTPNNCIRYIFTVDSTGTRNYAIQIIENGVTNGEFGTYDVGSDRIEFCMDEEGEVFCERESIVLTSSTLALTAKDETTGCTRTLSFTKESSE